MEWDRIGAQWNEVKGTFLERYPHLEGEEVRQLDGRKEGLAEALRRRYGYSDEVAERHVEDWRNSLPDEGPVPTSTSGASTY